MAHLKELPFTRLQFYATAPYPCSYLEDRSARSQVATPAHVINADLYSQLVRAGFRRSGVFTYRPGCIDCQACTPIRLPVVHFAPTRSQQRAWKAHQSLQIKVVALEFDPEQYDLYLRYQASRHAGGGMDNDSREQYTQFLLQTRVNTRLIEFRDPIPANAPAGARGALRMVSIIDVLDDGLSSVYTFFDPDVPGASYGTYNVIWQVMQCRALLLPYLYLGYWIRECPKMSYKTKFQPFELLHHGQWQSGFPETP